MIVPPGEENRPNIRQGRNPGDREQLKAMVVNLFQTYNPAAIKEAISRIPNPVPREIEIDELAHLLEGWIQIYGSNLLWEVIRDCNPDLLEQIRTNQGNTGLIINPANLIGIKHSGRYVRKVRMATSSKQENILEREGEEEWRITMLENGSATFYFAGMGMNTDTNTITIPLQAEDEIVQGSPRGQADKGLIVVKSSLS